MSDLFKLEDGKSAIPDAAVSAAGPVDGPIKISGFRDAIPILIDLLLYQYRPIVDETIALLVSDNQHRMRCVKTLAAVHVLIRPQLCLRYGRMVHLFQTITDTLEANENWVDEPDKCEAKAMELVPKLKELERLCYQPAPGMGVTHTVGSELTVMRADDSDLFHASFEFDNEMRRAMLNVGVDEMIEEVLSAPCSMRSMKAHGLVLRREIKRQEPELDEDASGRESWSRWRRRNLRSGGYELRPPLRRLI